MLKLRENPTKGRRVVALDRSDFVAGFNIL